MNIQQFLQEEKLHLLNRIAMSEQFRIPMDGYIKDHDARVINFILGEVEKYYYENANPGGEIDFIEMLNNLRVKLD